MCSDRHGRIGALLPCPKQDENSLTASIYLWMLPKVCRYFDSSWIQCISNVDETLLQRNLGDVIRAERIALGLSQEELAERCQLHRTYIGSVERGERNISIQNVVRIANALNTRVWMLIRAAEESKASP
jgi:DNA-binding XRE family transcriptional regulator